MLYRYPKSKKCPYEIPIKGRMPGNRLVRFPAYIMKKFIQNSIYYASSFLLFDDSSIRDIYEEMMCYK